MNIKNALGFFVLGLLMHTAPTLAQALSVNTVIEASTVRAAWLEFMSWVIAGIGFGYLAHEGAVRVQAFMLAVVPARLLRPSEVQPEQIQIQTAVRVGITY